MDAHNLAVVFGPTLIRVSVEDDMISSQGHFNKVLETIIKSYDLVFDGDGVDAVVDEFEDDDDEARQTEDEISRDEESDTDDELEPKDAIALYNYTARSSKELSFKKGDLIQVFKRSNSDWWDGCLGNVDGYVPCAYVQIIDEDNDSPPESLRKPQSLPLDSQSSVDDVFPSPPSIRTTPLTPTVGLGHRPSYHVHKPSTPEVIPEDTHLSSFKRSSTKRPESPTTHSNSLERSRSMENRDSPKTTNESSRTTSLPRSSQLWQKRGVQPESPATAEVRGIAEGMNSPGVEIAPQQFSRIPPPAPKPKPKPKVPKRHSNPSTELIASLQAGAMARTMRESREQIPDDPNELPPAPCSEREVIGGEVPSSPNSPVSKQDTFL